MTSENKSNPVSLNSIAEQWVNIVFAHLEYDQRNKQNKNKEENKNGESKS